jgi:hypothetical protein
MKISKICALALLLIVGSVLAFADGINDPQIIVHGVGSGGSGPQTCPPGGCQGVGLNFNFSVPPSGSGTLYFTNTSGVNWTSLALIEVCKNGSCPVPAVDIKCHSYLFESCKTETLKDGNVEILLSGVKGSLNPDKGIRAGSSFSITFACVGKSCWPGGLNFNAHANVGTVPEPGTIALMVTGLGTLVSRRKTWKNRWNS